MRVVACRGLTKAYGHTKVLDGMNFNLEENKITGLIGRNGVGKTTLLKLIAGFYKETSGEIKVWGERPFNSLNVSANTIFVDDHMSFAPALNLGEILGEMGRFYANWNAELARRLFDYFSFHPKQSHDTLSKGKRNTFNMIIGLASRCPLTIFDEPTTGMDAAVRKDFYRALLKDYLASPRTIIVSSHHLDEIEDLLEDILLIDKGEVLLNVSMEEMKEYAVGISGKESVLEEWLLDREVLYAKSLGPDSKYVVVKKDYGISEAARHGLTLTPVSASDACVYLTNKAKGGIDDVFK
ncbi:ABC transporter ATP-binding protein [Bacillus tianshenii]|uniref:ATP-binding cassette domain-containing protein n=1 Tax=Sutcliffiella tianshenii TaxID=1463404 RepID=UPI001CD4899B|nr:ABC transporter ATP-binding protein [Bacillus tianshenii]MCA1320635.1 ABC transporter ATP-binding protein [Bacillus tianshenii]